MQLVSGAESGSPFRCLSLRSDKERHWVQLVSGGLTSCTDRQRT
eukprot:SAG22_NODE_4918_length_1133_cov_1.346228_1_plen_43_part_10